MPTFTFIIIKVLLVICCCCKVCVTVINQESFGRIRFVGCCILRNSLSAKTVKTHALSFIQGPSWNRVSSKISSESLWLSFAPILCN